MLGHRPELKEIMLLAVSEPSPKAVAPTVSTVHWEEDE
jgi:hypothetical protein